MYGEKAWQQLHQNAASNIEQFLEATTRKTESVRPHTVHPWNSEERSYKAVKRPTTTWERECQSKSFWISQTSTSWEQTDRTKLKIILKLKKYSQFISKNLIEQIRYSSVFDLLLLNLTDLAKTGDVTGDVTESILSLFKDLLTKVY